MDLSRVEICFKEFFFFSHLLESEGFGGAGRCLEQSGMRAASGLKERQMGMRNGPSSPVLR